MLKLGRAEVTSHVDHTTSVSRMKEMLAPCRVFNSGRKKKSEPTDKTDISGISGFFIFIFYFLFIYLFFYLLFSIKNIH